ncbi:hypothetical protein, partial [Diaphorobacter sp.]|uniref:hypothetical protein n=1 Tax=Diaphorobacter sp. TaxID=1934310 RepID=UPI0025880A15
SANGTASNYGVEFELRKNLGFISDYTRYFSFNMNLAIIESEITVEQNNVSDKRTMWGQSPYSLNLGLPPARRACPSRSGGFHSRRSARSVRRRTWCSLCAGRV